MTSEPREDDGTAEAVATKPILPLTSAPGLQALDLGVDAGIGMVCDIDDPDCNPMAFAGTAGAPSEAGDDA